MLWELHKLSSVMKSGADISFQKWRKIQQQNVENDADKIFESFNSMKNKIIECFDKAR